MTRMRCHIALYGQFRYRVKGNWQVYDEGAEVYLSRRNTVSHDTTIDDEEQACLFFSDGHWFIEDRSRNNSTYVHAGAGIKLEPGDIIRMGDRLFEFNIKSRKE